MLERQSDRCRSLRCAGPRNARRAVHRSPNCFVGRRSDRRGLHAECLRTDAGAELDRGGRVIVDRFCNIPGHPEIFVIGDASLFKDEDGKPLPGVAPTAMQQGSYVASAIRKRVRGRRDRSPSSYLDKGTLAVIGRARAVAQFGSKLALQRDP